MLAPDEVEAIRALGDNTGSMTLKGAAPDHEGGELPDRSPVSPELAALGARHGIDAARDLARAAA